MKPKSLNFNKVLNEAGLNIDAIEPAVVAYIRACYAKIHDKFVKEKTELLATKLKEGIPFCDLLQNGNQVELKIRTLEDAYLDTPIAETAHADKPSAIAVGLALKLLNFSNCGLNINLLPPESAEVKSARKHVLIIANTSENLDGMNAILSAGSFLRWDLILNEIRAAIPKTVRITNFFSDDNSRVLFRGQALSYESIDLFVDILNNSELIESASLIGTEKDSVLSGLITYSISCSLIK